MNIVDDLSAAFARFPGIGVRQAKRFVYHLLSTPPSERAKLAKLIGALGTDVHQCSECLRFYSGTKTTICNYCSDPSRDDAQLMLVEKDQDLAALERAGTYHGRYFVLGGVLTLSGKGAIREKELVKRVEKGLHAKPAEDGSQQNPLKEIVLALSATSEGEHTSDRVRALLQTHRDALVITELGRGLSTGSELEYSDAETLRAALAARKET